MYKGKFLDIGIRNCFLDTTIKAQEIKAKVSKLY